MYHCYYKYITYNVGKPMKLSEKAEEAATFFGKMLDHDYTKKDVFCNNFFADWRKAGIYYTYIVHVHNYISPMNSIMYIYIHTCTYHSMNSK